jgi:hypothetical protein
MSTAVSRTDYYARMQTYWSAPSSRLGLKHWEMSKAGADTRTCAYCGEEYPLEEFWTGSKLSYVCSADQGKSKERRNEVEQEAVDENEQSDEQDEGDGSESDDADEQDDADTAGEAA